MVRRCAGRAGAAQSSPSHAKNQRNHAIAAALEGCDGDGAFRIWLWVRQKPALAFQQSLGVSGVL